MSKITEVPIIIPSLEPDERLLDFLQKLKQDGFEDIVLVNDGSSTKYDRYFVEAEQKYGCVVLMHAVNLGKGRALKTAFNYVLNRNKENDIKLLGCVTADSDGQHTPNAVQKCIAALYKQPNNLVLGCRNFDDESVPWKSQFGNKLTRLMFKLFVGLKITDTQTGLRAIPKAFMQEQLKTDGERFEYETNMLIEAKKMNISITEVPIETIYDSKDNHVTHFDPIKDSLKIYKIFGKFIFSSLSSCVIDLALFALFVWLLKPWVTYHIIIATCLARVISAIYNYLINHSLVFDSKASHKKAATKYFILAVIQMSCSALLVNGLFELLQINETFIKVFVDGCLFFISFFIQREIVYKNNS